MRFFFIGAALLLTIPDVNGAFSELTHENLESQKDLVPKATVTGASGEVDCSKMGKGEFVSAAPDELKNVCKPDQKGYVKDRAFVKFFYSGVDQAKDYLCCIHKEQVCGSSELAFNGDKRKVCKTNADCGNDFCVMDKNDEEKKKISEVNTAHWANMNICCRKRDASEFCDIGRYRGPMKLNECMTASGRCKNNKGVCTWKGAKDEESSACCSQTKEAICPGEALPYAVETRKAKQSKVFDFRLNDTHGLQPGEAEKSCLNLPDSFIYEGKLCCQKYKMVQSGNLSFGVAELKTELFGGLLLPRANVSNQTDLKDCSTDTSVCINEEWCAPVEVTGNENPKVQKGQLSLCYPKPTCPHPSKKIFPVKRVSGQGPVYSCSVETKDCGDKSYCVLINSAAGTSASKFWDSNSTLCCPRYQYDNPCSVEVGRKRNPLVDKPGSVLDVAGSNCTDDVNATREWTPLNDGQGASSHKLCCEWKKPDTAALKKFESETCKTGGKLKIMSGLVLQCPSGNADGLDCESSTGKCRSVKGNASVTACCIEDYCPHTNQPMAQTPDCDSDDCIFHKLTLQPMKDKHCRLDSSNKKKCCVPPPNCVTENGKEHCGFNNLFPKDTNPVELKDKCKDSADCGGFGKYCNVTSSLCYFVPSSHVAKSIEKPCKKTEECKKEGAKFTFHCVMFKKSSEFGECLTFTKLVTSEHKANRVLVMGVIALTVIGLVFLTAGVIMFLKYRSRNFCDTKKADKTKGKRGKDTTTSDGTTGGTTGGETTGGK